MIPAVVAVPSSTGMRGRFSYCSTLYCAPSSGPGGGQHEHDDQADQPDGQALAGAVEAGHPAGDVAAGQVGQEEDDEDGDAAADADLGGLVGGLVGGVDVLREPEGHAGRRQQRRSG